MKKIILALFLSSLILSCTSSDNAPDPISLDGATFTRSSYVIETPVDGNGDGTFSNDLMEENFCFELNLQFDGGNTSSIPTNDVFTMDVIDNGGTMTQLLNCSHGDGPGMQYTIEDNVVSFYYNNDFYYSGIISDDENTITINLENSFLWVFNWNDPKNKILNSDGSITDYQGGAVVTYTRQ